MLINLVRLGMMDEAKKICDSLNGYLNIYKNHMMTSIRAIDFFNNIKEGKNCNEQGCKIDRFKKSSRQSMSLNILLIKDFHKLYLFKMKQLPYFRRFCL